MVVEAVTGAEAAALATPKEVAPNVNSAAAAIRVNVRLIFARILNVSIVRRRTKDGQNLIVPPSP